jgi:hypothetical protein
MPVGKLRFPAIFWGGLRAGALLRLCYFVKPAFAHGTGTVAVIERHAVLGFLLHTP